MKFNKRKKTKMKKIRQRRIRRCYGDMTGYHIFFENLDDKCKVIDQIQIKGDIYFLTEIDENQYAIYKIVKIGEYVKLSNKKILSNRQLLCNPDRWNNHSEIEISRDGEIEVIKKINIYDVIIVIK